MIETKIAEWNESYSIMGYQIVYDEESRTWKPFDWEKHYRPIGSMNDEELNHHIRER